VQRALVVSGSEVWRTAPLKNRSLQSRLGKPNPTATRVHIHVQHQDSYAKFWLTPVCLARSKGYDAPTLNKLHSLVRANEMLFLEKWNEHFTR